MGWKRLDQIALDMPTLFDDIEEEVLKVEDSEIEEVITVGEHTRVRRPKEQHLSYDHLPKVDEYLSVPRPRARAHVRRHRVPWLQAGNRRGAGQLRRRAGIQRPDR